MVAAVPLFVSGVAESVAAFAVKCLAVAGGFLAGFVIGGVVAFALDRWLFARKTPDPLKTAARVLTGAAVALLVAFVVFGDGSGGGLFGGSGAGGTGKGANPSPDPGKQPDTTPDVKVVPRPDTNPSPSVAPGTPTVRVTFLGGDAVQGNRFYLLDDDPAPKSFEELKAAVLKKKEATTGPLVLRVQFPADDRVSIGETSINVTQVTNWARNTAGIEVVWPRK